MVPYEGWQEAKLAAVKETALGRFLTRRPLLEPYLQGELMAKAAADIVADLRRWPGKFLLMEPTEVLEGDARIHKASFEAILRALDAATPNPDEIDALLQRFSGTLSTNPDRRLCQVLGYTYAWGI